MTEHQDFFEEIVADDPQNQPLAASLADWRNHVTGDPVPPDDRLNQMFSGEPTPKQPAKWRQWLQQPAAVFAMSFVAVLVLGIGAFTLVSNSSAPAEVAAPTTSALSAPDAEPTQFGDVSLPEDLSDQAGYASCVFDQLTAWFDSGLDSDQTPAIIEQCGTPPIPDLGPEAEAFRQDLQAWATCAAGEVQALLPRLKDLKDGGDDIDPLADCGEPPNPTDYGLELPFLDFGDIDPSQFDFGPFNLEEFKLKFDEFKFDDFDPEGLLGKFPPEFWPEGFDPENFDPEQFKEFFEGFEFKEFNFEDCKPDDGASGEDKSLEGLFSHLEACGFGFLGGGELGDLDLSTLFGRFGDFDIEGFEGLEELDLESLFGDLDLEQLLADLFADEELDLGSLFKQFSDQST